MPINKDPSTPPPMIAKMGPYTVFKTPPSTPKPVDQQPVFDSPKKVVSPPPVQPPPQQIDKSHCNVSDNGSVSGFFRNAVSKVQNAHSSLDDHLARWFGLNQSKYQWALDDYYESKGLGLSILELNDGRGLKKMAAQHIILCGPSAFSFFHMEEKDDSKVKEMSKKLQSV